jgi:hypothetical protein
VVPGIHRETDPDQLAPDEPVTQIPSEQPLRPVQAAAADPARGGQDAESQNTPPALADTEPSQPQSAEKDTGAAPSAAIAQGIGERAVVGSNDPGEPNDTTAETPAADTNKDDLVKREVQEQASALLQTAREEARARDENLPLIRVKDMPVIKAFRGTVRQWADAAVQAAAANNPDITNYVTPKRAAASFVHLYGGHARLNDLELLNNTELAQAAWDNYWDGVMRLKKAGFERRIEAIAEHNSPDELIKHIRTSDNPDRDRTLAETRVTDAMGRIQQYHADVERMTHHFASNSDATPKIIDSVARSVPSSPLDYLASHLDRVAAVRETYVDNPAVSEEVYASLCTNPTGNPAEAVERYLERREVFMTHRHVNDRAAMHLAIESENYDPQNYAALAQGYQERLATLQAWNEFEARNMPDDELMTLAARRGHGAERQRYYAFIEATKRRVERAESHGATSTSRHFSPEAHAAHRQDREIIRAYLQWHQEQERRRQT